MRAYTVTLDEYEGTILGIVADTAKEARLIAYNSGDIDRPWIKITAEWRKGIDVTGLSKGIVPPFEGVKRGLYEWTIDKCPVCKKTKELCLQTGGTIECNECYEDRAIIQQPLQPDSTQ